MPTMMAPPTAPAFTQQLSKRCLAYRPQAPARSFRFGNTTLSAVFIGANNPDFFTKAVAHLEVSPGLADLTVYVIDHKTSAIMLPPPCWNWQQADGHGLINDLSDGYSGYFQQDTGVFMWVAYAERMAIIWGTDLTILPEWEQSFPFRYVLHKWQEYGNRYVLVHAGAVGTPAGGVLLTGASGAGKSTGTLACINTALHYAGDDFVMIDLESPFVHSLYNIAKINPDNLHRFPNFRPLIDNPDAALDQKFQVYLYQHYPDSVIAGFPLKAIMLPHFSGKTNTTIRWATPAEALKALAPSTMALLRADQRTFQKMSRLVNQLPLFWLETGTDLAQIPALILSTIQSLSDYESASH